MANSTTNLDILSSNAQQELGANALFNSTSPSILYARRESTTTGLTWGYYGGFTTINGTYTSVSNATIALTANLTNYIEVSPAGVLSKNTTGFTTGSIPLYSVVVGPTTITSYIDYRRPLKLPIANANQAVITLGNTNSEISGLTFSATPTQAEVEALRDKCEELADDVRALSTLIHQIRTDLITAYIIKGSA